MLSYHNDENLKNLVVLEMKKHQEQDQFIKGRYQAEEYGIFKGCAVGCTIDSLNLVLNKSYSKSKHSVFEEALGIPEWLAILQDKFFEELPESESSQFAVDFLSAIPVGVNLEPAKWKFCSFLLKEGIDRIANQENLLEELKKEVLTAMRGVLLIHENALKVGLMDINTARSAALSAAWSALSAESAAESAALSAESAALSARSAVWSASLSAESAVESAAWSAWFASESAVWSASLSAESAESARPDAFKRYSNELIKILKETKGEI